MSDDAEITLSVRVEPSLLGALKLKLLGVKPKSPDEIRAALRERVVLLQEYHQMLINAQFRPDEATRIVAGCEWNRGLI